MRNRMGSSLNLDTTVVGLQGLPISTTPPTSGQALVFDGTDWVPTTVQTGGGGAAVGPNPPGSPNPGDLWFDDVNNILNVWNGTAWVPTYVDNDPYLPLAGGTLTGPLVLSGNATAPLNPVSLQQLDTALSLLPPPASVGNTPPASPGNGDLWFNTTNNTLNVWNGTAWVPVAPSTPVSLSGTTTSIVFFFPGKPAASQIIRVPMAIAITIANLFVGSEFTVGTNPTAAAVFNVLANGTSFGTASVSTAGAVTWTGGAWALNPGDVLEVEAPTTQDATLADVAFTILATRT